MSPPTLAPALAPSAVPIENADLSIGTESVRVKRRIGNLLTFDVEDWQPLADEWVCGIRTAPSGRVPIQLERIRRILDRTRVRATFFWLGSTARDYPQALRTLAREGHEIASHGDSHRPLGELDQEAFERDLLQAQETIASISGQVPLGFRAPQFSVQQHTRWGLEVLAKHGFRYDSSIFPIRHRRYGVPGFGRSICRIATAYGPLVEVPLATVSVFGARLPVAGGGYFRLMPRWAVLGALDRINDDGLPFVTYFHPYEYDPARLNLSLTVSGWRLRWRTRLFVVHQNLGRKSVPEKLEALLTRASFGSCMTSLQEAGIL